MAHSQFAKPPRNRVVVFAKLYEDACTMIFFSFRFEQDHIYDILDDDLNIVH